MRRRVHPTIASACKLSLYGTLRQVTRQRSQQSGGAPHISPIMVCTPTRRDRRSLKSRLRSRWRPSCQLVRLTSVKGAWCSIVLTLRTDASNSSQAETHQPPAHSISQQTASPGPQTSQFALNSSPSEGSAVAKFVCETYLSCLTLTLLRIAGRQG